MSCNYSQITLAQKISASIRIFESYAYQIALLISGKSDCVLFQNRPIASEGLELLIREAGGLSAVKNGVFIGSNYQLHEQIKGLL